MVKAKKHFGQNFLQDSFYLDKIISAMPDTDRQVVEIGPGLGDLTDKLLKKRKVISIEVDKELDGVLKNRFHTELESGRFRLIIGDATTEDVKAALPEAYDLVANLPYYVATNMILTALSDDRCKNIVVLVQKEVAHKFCADCGDSDYGSISVLTQLAACKRAVLFDVPPNAFVPAPKVVSAVIKIEKSDSIDKTQVLNVSKLLKLAFAAPRKTALKNLSNTFDKTTLHNLFDELGIDHNKRPHEITAQNFIQLSGCLIKQ